MYGSTTIDSQTFDKSNQLSVVIITDDLSEQLHLLSSSTKIKSLYARTSPIFWVFILLLAGCLGLSSYLWNGSLSSRKELSLVGISGTCPYSPGDPCFDTDVIARDDSVSPKYKAIVTKDGGIALYAFADLPDPKWWYYNFYIAKPHWGKPYWSLFKEELDFTLLFFYPDATTVDSGLADAYLQFLDEDQNLVQQISLGDVQLECGSLTFKLDEYGNFTISQSLCPSVVILSASRQSSGPKNANGISPSPPTSQPTPQPTRITTEPTRTPSVKPSRKPSHKPTRKPTRKPSIAPTIPPTMKPSPKPTSPRPTARPSMRPAHS